jgi:NAD(P)-dependent dehydrogenase (short-subunit alcohol dehydrogenase family)
VTKHGVVALSEALYNNLAQSNSRIGVSVLCPGLINTRIMYAFRNRPARLLNTPGVPATERELARAERVGNMASELGLAPDAQPLPLRARRRHPTIAPQPAARAAPFRRLTASL